MRGFFKPRRILGLGLVATSFVWVQAAGYFEGQRIDAQRAEHPAAATRTEPLRIDSEGLMDAVTTLASPWYEGRATGSPGNLAARAWITERFAGIGLSPVAGSFVFPFHFTHVSLRAVVDPERPITANYTAANVVGQCLGTNSGLPVYVLSAHFDHLGIRGGVMYPGADDNASGVAVMLAIAEYCHRTPFTHTVVFAAFDSEELGLQGSKAFLIAPPLPKSRMALNINLDMVSRNDRRELFVAPTARAVGAGRQARAHHVALRSRQADDGGWRGRGLDVSIRPRVVPRGEDPVGLFRRRRPRRLPQAHRHGR
jgi:hypothetical protein